MASTSKKRRRATATIDLSDHKQADDSRARHTTVTVRPTCRKKAKAKFIPVSIQVPQEEDNSAMPSESISGPFAAEPDPMQAQFNDGRFDHGKTIIITPADVRGARRQRRGHGGKRKQRIDQLKDFEKLRDTILDEVMRHEGLKEHEYPATCATCIERTECISTKHACEPLHQIQKWNGSCFEHSTLRETGLVIQIGHDGAPCPHPHQSIGTLTLIDMSGIHVLSVRYCDCACLGSSEAYTQLIRARWWPVTFDRPQTAVTFRTLELFHALTLQGKLNGYDYYNALVRMTDGSGLRQPKSRYKEFTRAVRCFRHIRMAKCSRRGHDAMGILATTLGSMVVKCPACPHPGRNLPDGWQLAPAHLQFLYTMFVAMDANFKLKLKNHNYSDIELAPGWSYFVSDDMFKGYLVKYKDQAEMKTCDSSFAAIDHANNAGQKRFSINGVGAIVCGRHSFFLPNAVCDLERGERYANMDFILLMTIMLIAEYWLLLVISYDIACHFSKNFKRRMLELPESLQMKPEMKVSFIVPKFHLPAHGPSCQVKYSFNFTEGVGRTCGEGVEANWAETNGVSLSTREMSAGARHETLNDIFGAMNWRKITTMGSQLAHSLKDAVINLAKQQPKYEDIRQMFPLEVCNVWDAMIKDWDNDKTKPNPYEEPEFKATLGDVRLSLARQEAQELSQGGISLHEMTVSTFLNAGIDLQEQQRNLCGKSGDDDSDTATQKASLQDRRNALHHRIKTWRTVQAIYMPIAVSLLPADSAPDQPSSHDTPKPEYEKLWLPSDVPQAMRETGLHVGLVAKEQQLRMAEAEDALHELRRMIHIRMGLRHYKSIHVHGPSQERNTRARNLLKKFTAKRDRQFERYKAARSALDSLDPNPDSIWRRSLLPMKKADLVDPSGDDDEKSSTIDNGSEGGNLDDATRSVSSRAGQSHRARGPGEGRKEVPWIWQTLKHDSRDVPGGDKMTAEEVHNSMRVTYAKARAHVRRWREEVLFIQEEMLRTVVFLQWKAQWWLSCKDARDMVRDDLKSGLCAYAIRQASIQNGLAAMFQDQWSPLLQKCHLRVQWPARPAPVVVVVNEVSEAPNAGDDSPSAAQVAPSDVDMDAADTVSATLLADPFTSINEYQLVGVDDLVTAVSNETFNADDLESEAEVSEDELYEGNSSDESDSADIADM